MTFTPHAPVLSAQLRSFGGVYRDETRLEKVRAHSLAMYTILHSERGNETLDTHTHTDSDLQIHI